MKDQFQKVMGYFTGTSMVVGIVVGTGIFLTAGDIAKKIESPSWLLIAWAVGGLLATMGAITMAQLSSIYPQSGGLYLYIREAFGEMPAFLYGCISFLVLQCGSIAAIAVGFSSYFGTLIPNCDPANVLLTLGSWSFSTGQLIAISVILLLTFINYIGAKTSTIVQFTLTCFTLLSICIFLGMAFSVTRPIPVTFSLQNPPSFSIFALTLVPILWAFSGWHNLNFAAEEVKNTKRTITVSLLAAMGIIISLYLLINFIYITSLSMDAITKEKQIAHTVINLLFPIGAPIVSIAIVVSALGSLNGLIFASPRAYFAMARDGLFPLLKPSLHKKHATPHQFIIAQCIWSICLIIAGKGSYNNLFTYVMFSGFLFTSLAGVAVVILKKRTQEKISLSWAYPVIPIFFTLYSIALAINTCYYMPSESLTGIALIILCIPFYFKMKSSKK